MIVEHYSRASTADFPPDKSKSSYVREKPQCGGGRKAKFPFSYMEMERLGFSVSDYSFFNELRNLICEEWASDSVISVVFTDAVFELHINTQFSVEACFFFVFELISVLIDEFGNAGF